VDKVFILAGEPSGDLHGSLLAKQLFLQHPNLEIKGWGGDSMKSQGVEILRTLDHLAFMGFIEVAKKFSTIFQNFRLCKKQITEFDPDVIVFIDYPGFNLRMAKWAKSKGFKTIQYIAPAVWAWKEGRLKTIKKYVDELLVILPFEKEYFYENGIEAHYVGHPLVEEISLWKEDPIFKLPNAKKVNIGLFPGSRLQEIKYILPDLIQLAKSNLSYQFYIAVPKHLDLDVYTEYTADVKNVDLIKDYTYDLLSKIDAAMVASGTATLEVALFNVPQIVCYKTSPISYLIAKRLVKTKYISLVNLIFNREVVKELIQGDMNQEKLQKYLSLLLKSFRSNDKRIYGELRNKLTMINASKKAADIILEV